MFLRKYHKKFENISDWWGAKPWHPKAKSLMKINKAKTIASTFAKIQLMFVANFLFWLFLLKRYSIDAGPKMCSHKALTVTESLAQLHRITETLERDWADFILRGKPPARTGTGICKELT